MDHRTAVAVAAAVAGVVSVVVDENVSYLNVVAMALDRAQRVALILLIDFRLTVVVLVVDEQQW